MKQADRCPQHCTVLFAGKIYINPLARPNWLPNHCVFVTNPTVVLILFLWLIKQTYQVRESVFALFFISWGVVFQGNIVFRIILYKCSAHLGRGAETTSNNLNSNKEHDHHWCQRRCKLYFFLSKSLVSFSSPMCGLVLLDLQMSLRLCPWVKTSKYLPTSNIYIFNF